MCDDEKEGRVLTALNIFVYLFEQHIHHKKTNKVNAFNIFAGQF